MKEKLIKKFEEKTAIIGIIGLGYVGLPLVLRYIESGFNVIGFDIDVSKVTKINSGVSYIDYIPNERIKSAVQNRKLLATSDFSKISEVDSCIICVPTPLNKYREPDLSYVIDTVDSIIPFLRKGQIVSLESTTYPGTTDEEIVPKIEAKGFKIGESVFVVFSPEREDPGNKEFQIHTIPKVVGGVTENCLAVGIKLYEQAAQKVVPVSSTKVAEMTKLLENIQRAVNIGLVNEMKILADQMGIDIFEVVDAAATKPFGFAKYYPGPGLGGHCIPIDPFYLTWKAREYGIHTRFIELAGEINSSMPEYVISKLTEALNFVGKSVKGSRILILGLAYKKNVDDVRESPSVALMEILRKKGARIDYHDPFIPTFPKMRSHSFDLSSISLDIDEIKNFDAVILATDHDRIDYEFVRKNAKMIIDTRGKYRSSESHIIKS